MPVSLVDVDSPFWTQREGLNMAKRDTSFILCPPPPTQPNTMENGNYIAGIAQGLHKDVGKNIW